MLICNLLLVGGTAQIETAIHLLLISVLYVSIFLHQICWNNTFPRGMWLGSYFSFLQRPLMEAFFTKERSISSHLVSSALLYFTGKYLHSDIETAGLNVRIMNSSDVSLRCGNSAVPRRNITGLHSDCKTKEFRTQHMKSCPCVTTLQASIQINQPTRCNSFTSFLLDVYVWLNIFRASLRPSSRAYNCTRSLWFYSWSVVVGALLVVVQQTRTAVPAAP